MASGRKPELVEGVTAKPKHDNEGAVATSWGGVSIGEKNTLLLFPGTPQNLIKNPPNLH